MIAIEIESGKIKPFVDKRITYINSRLNEQQQEINDQIEQYEKDLLLYNQKPFLKRLFSFKPKDPRNTFEHQHLPPISVDTIILHHWQSDLYDIEQINEKLNNTPVIKMTKTELDLLNLDVIIKNNQTIEIKERG